jgi:hypothetical protein
MKTPLGQAFFAYEKMTWVRFFGTPIFSLKVKPIWHVSFEIDRDRPPDIYAI